MNAKSNRYVRLAVALIVAVPLMGCIFAADLMNPEFFSSLGLDPATIVPPAGRVIVAFKNDTTGVASFSALVAYTEQVDSEGNALDVSRLAALNVDAGETRTLVVDCPFVSVLPEQFAVATSGGVATWTYQGISVVYGKDFSCGDIVEISIVQIVNADGTPGFDNRVRILPGR